MYRHLIRIRKGGILGRGEKGGGLKGMLLCPFTDCVGIKCLTSCRGNDEVFDQFSGQISHYSYVIVKINTISRIRPITFSKALLTEFFVLCYCIYEYQVDLLDLQRDSIAVLIDITLSSAWPYTNVYVIFGRSAPFTGKQR